MRRFAPFPLVGALLVPSPALAEVDLTANVGVRFGGQVETDIAGGETVEPAPAYGLTLDVALAPDKWLVLLWSRQRTEFGAPGILPDSDTFELGIDYFHVGGMYRPQRHKGAHPFVMVTLGLTWVEPEPAGFDSGLAASALAGGGAKIPIGERIGVRFDARAYLTFTGAALGGTCGGVGCSVEFAGNGALQFEGLVGVSFSFGAPSRGAR